MFVFFISKMYVSVLITKLWYREENHITVIPEKNSHFIFIISIIIHYTTILFEQVNIIIRNDYIDLTVLINHEASTKFRF